jgi:hypothetical protein
VALTGNAIHLSQQQALAIADDAASWFESGPVADVLFANNSVRLDRGATWAERKGVVTVSPTNTREATVHRGLRVLGNDIFLHAGSAAPVVRAKSIAGVVLAGNRIHSPGRPIAPAQMVEASNCSGVVVENNTVTTARALSTDMLPVANMTP